MIDGMTSRLLAPDHVTEFRRQERPTMGVTPTAAETVAGAEPTLIDRPGIKLRADVTKYRDSINQTFFRLAAFHRMRAAADKGKAKKRG